MSSGKYVTNLICSLLLKQSGCPQDSDFYWVKLFNSREQWQLMPKEKVMPNAIQDGLAISAYTHEELESLPAKTPALVNLSAPSSHSLH